MSRRKKSIFDYALGNNRNRRHKTLADLGSGKTRRKKRGRGGLVGMFESQSKRRKKGNKGDLSSYLGMANSKKSKGAPWKITRTAGQTLSRRLTRTERMQVEELADDELERDPRLSAYYQNERLTGNESFLRRLVRLVRERVGLFGK